MNTDPKALLELKRQVADELASYDEKKKLAAAIDLVSKELEKRGLLQSDHGAGSLFATNESMAAKDRGPKLVKIQNGEYGANTRLVKDAILAINGAFGLTKVYDFLAKNNTPLQKPEIATVLVRLKAKGMISVLKAGRGQNPAVYVPAQILSEKNSNQGSVAA